jgi:hypothetical protein
MGKVAVGPTIVVGMEALHSEVSSAGLVELVVPNIKSERRSEEVRFAIGRALASTF